MHPSVYAALVLALALPARGEPPALNSHEVNSDHSVTFRYFGPAARQVTLSLDFDLTPIPLGKGADGVWKLTTKPLQPELHLYTFLVDGVPTYDPRNPDIKPNLVFKNNVVRVVRPEAQLWDVANVPHGAVHRHSYASRLIQGLTDGQEEYYVYTPPGYEAGGSKRYPVLYLLHGWSGLADDWIQAGQAPDILDNLFAQGRAMPMIVVMPQCYGAMSFVRSGFKAWDDPNQVAENIGLFDAALFQEIIPQVDRTYRTTSDHAIAGLSMGGGQSLIIGLNHPGFFGWIGGFSSALPLGKFDGVFPRLTPAGAPRLVWIACGTEEPENLVPTRKFVAWLKAKGLRPMAVETPGIHNWHTWRDNLIHFAPLLFAPSS